MSMLEELFQLSVLSEAGGTCRFACKINANHPVFAGHFPGMPIMPGVCLLNAVKQSLSLLIGREVFFSKIRECKFLSVVNPTEENELEIEVIVTPEKEIRAAVFKGKTQCLKLKATFS